MRILFTFMCGLALGVTGCSETSGTGGSGGSAGSGGDGGVSTATVGFFIEGYRPGVIIAPEEGVEICETDTTNCVLTDANGNAGLELPVGQETSYTLVKEGFASFLDLLIVPANGITIITSVAPNQRVEEMYGLVMSPYPMEGTGMIFIEEVGNPGGVTFELLGATGKVFYRDNDANWSSELMATTSGGPDPGGGGFTEVSLGVCQVEFGKAGAGCSVRRGWRGQSPQGPGAGGLLQPCVPYVQMRQTTRLDVRRRGV
jgi:hypothetical protein